MNYPASWSAVSLDELCEISIGKTPARDNRQFWGAEFPWLSIGDMSQGRFITSTKESITTDAVRRCNCKLVAPATLLLSFKLSIGKVGFNQIPLYTNEAIAALPIKRPDLIDKNFLYWALQLIDLDKDTDKAAKGKTLNKAKLKEIVIPVPPLPEQRRIAAILDKADALREKRRQAIAKLDTLLKSVFIEMFGDPVTNPKGWERKKLSEVGTLDRGRSKHRPRNAPELLGGRYPLIQTGDVANANGYIVRFTQTYSELGLKQSKMWKAGTLCITIAANIAKTAILTFDACFPDSVVGFIPNDLTTTEFVQHWLSFLQKTLEDAAPESAQKNINLKILSELDIPSPPKALQEEFTNAVKSVEALKSRYRLSCLKAEELFQSLQQRAFSGELFTEKAVSVPHLVEVSQHA